MKGENILETDVVIIGGGSTGAAIARELSRYKSDTILLEKMGELAGGQSKTSFGIIYAGLNMVGSMIIKSVVLAPGTPLNALYDPNKLLTKWNEEGFREWPQVSTELDIKYSYLPLLILAKGKDQVEDLKRYIELGKSIGGIYADFKQLNREEILALEPNVTKDVTTGLYAKDHIIDIFPPEAVIAMAENASQNGVRVLLNAEATGVSQKGQYQMVQTAQGIIKTKFIVNAAGGRTDKIADMCGGRDWGLQFNKTQIVILDKHLKGLVNSMVRFPNRPGAMEIITPRENNIMVEWGTYDPTDSLEDTDTMRESVISAMAKAKTLVPSISEKDIINTYTGVRVFNTRNPENHIVEFSPNNPRFLNVIIRLPGFIGAFPMARHVVKMLGDAGLELVSKIDFNPYRKAIPRFRDLSDEIRNVLIGNDPQYGHVVCRCETVTEGEIVEAIRRGATTEEGVRMRTRAGMGRCKGGFCGPRVVKILARELKIPVTEVKKRGLDSPLLLCRSKELLLRNKKGIA